MIRILSLNHPVVVGLLYLHKILPSWEANPRHTRLQSSPSPDQHQTRTVPNQQLAPKDEDRARNGDVETNSSEAADFREFDYPAYTTITCLMSARVARRAISLASEPQPGRSALCSATREARSARPR
jgi:hypothetical protein